MVKIFITFSWESILGKFAPLNPNIFIQVQVIWGLGVLMARNRPMCPFRSGGWKTLFQSGIFSHYVCSKLLGEELSNTSVVKHSDSIVQVINKTSCKNFNFVKLMRRLKVASLINSTFIFIPSKSLAFIIQHRILCLAYKYRDSKELFLYVEIEETLVAHALLHL